MHAQNKAGEAKEESKGYLQTAQEKAGSLFGQTQNEASKTKGEAKDNLNSAADKASDKADQAHKEGKGTQQSAPHLRVSVHVQCSLMSGCDPDYWRVSSLVPKMVSLLHAMNSCLLLTGRIGLSEASAASMWSLWCLQG